MTFTRQNANGSNNSIFEIKKNTLHTIKNGRSGREITCITGTLWITEDGNKVDRILSRGDIYRTKTSGQIVIQALETARIETTSTSTKKATFFNNSSNRNEPQLACA